MEGGGGWFSGWFDSGVEALEDLVRKMHRE